MKKYKRLEDVKDCSWGHYATNKKTITLQLCWFCQGLGSYCKSELVDYHNNEWESIKHECATCLGDGRVYVTEETFTIPEVVQTKCTTVPYELGKDMDVDTVELDHYRLSFKE